MIKKHFDGAITSINSGFRSSRHNRSKSVKGKRASKHRNGTASDVDVHGVDPDDVATYAEGIGLGGVGRYNTFTHIDVEGENRRWDNRT